LRLAADFAFLTVLPEAFAAAGVRLPPAMLAFKADMRSTTYSAFSTGRLHSFLRTKDISTPIITGSETDVCVLATVLAAVDLGYRIILVRDGLCSSSDEAHDALRGLYAKRFDIQIELADMASVFEFWRI